MSNPETAHTAKDIQDALASILGFAADAREEADGDDDDGDLADLARDIALGAEHVEAVRSFEEPGILSGGAGLVLRTASGAEFQISIVQSRLGNPS